MNLRGFGCFKGFVKSIFQRHPSRVIVNRKCTWAAVNLHSHRYPVVPGYRFQSDVACGYWWAQCVINNRILVLISIEHLNNWQGIEKIRVNFSTLLRFAQPDLGSYRFADWCWADKYMSFDAWMEDGPTDVRWIDGLDIWIGRKDNGWITELMHRWIDRWMNPEMDRLRGEWMDGRMYGIDR